MGLQFQKKRERERDLTLSNMWGHGKKKFVCKPGRGSSPETESAGTFILNFSATRTIRNKCLLFKPPRLWYFVIAAHRTKTIFFHKMNHRNERSLKSFPAKIIFHCFISSIKLYCQVNIAQPLLKRPKKINVKVI